MADLNNEIIAYLTVNNIPFTAGDFVTGIPAGSTTNQIIYWNTAKLGAEPTQAQLDAAWATYSGQQQAAANKAEAMSLLAATDWTEIPSVTNTANTPHLTNGAAFVTYRTQLRAIAVNPPTTPVTWPTPPVKQWS